MHSIQHYVIKFVSDLIQVDGFLRNWICKCLLNVCFISSIFLNNKCAKSFLLIIQECSDLLFMILIYLLCFMISFVGLYFYVLQWFIWVGFGSWRLTPLLAIFQLYRCYRWRKPEYPEKTIDLYQVKIKQTLSKHLKIQLKNRTKRQNWCQSHTYARWLTFLI
jgi:hypothetical protein